MPACSSNSTQHAPTRTTSHLRPAVDALPNNASPLLPRNSIAHPKAARPSSQASVRPQTDHLFSENRTQNASRAVMRRLRTRHASQLPLVHNFGVLPNRKNMAFIQQRDTVSGRRISTHSSVQPELTQRSVMFGALVKPSPPAVQVPRGGRRPAEAAQAVGARLQGMPPGIVVPGPKKPRG